MASEAKTTHLRFLLVQRKGHLQSLMNVFLCTWLSEEEYFCDWSLIPPYYTISHLIGITNAPRLISPGKSHFDGVKIMRPKGDLLPRVNVLPSRRISDNIRFVWWGCHNNWNDDNMNNHWIHRTKFRMRGAMRASKENYEKCCLRSACAWKEVHTRTRVLTYLLVFMHWKYKVFFFREFDWSFMRSQWNLPRAAWQRSLWMSEAGNAWRVDSPKTAQQYSDNFLEYGCWKITTEDVSNTFIKPWLRA